MAEAKSNLLLSTPQNEFKEDILRSLLLDDGINVNVRQSLEKLSNKRNFKLEELRNDWLNWGVPDYLTIRQVIENNVQFRAEQTQIIEEKNDRLIFLSEKNLQICVDGTAFGYNPRTQKFDEHVVFNQCVSTTFNRFKNLVDMEPLSAPVNLLRTLSSFI